MDSNNSLLDKCNENIAQQILKLPIGIQEIIIDKTIEEIKKEIKKELKEQDQKKNLTYLVNIFSYSLPNMIDHRINRNLTSRCNLLPYFENDNNIPSTILSYIQDTADCIVELCILPKFSTGEWSYRTDYDYHSLDSESESESDSSLFL